MQLRASDAYNADAADEGASGGSSTGGDRAEGLDAASEGVGGGCGGGGGDGSSSRGDEGGGGGGGGGGGSTDSIASGADEADEQFEALLTLYYATGVSVGAATRVGRWHCASYLAGQGSRPRACPRGAVNGAKEGDGDGSGVDKRSGRCWWRRSDCLKITWLASPGRPRPVTSARMAEPLVQSALAACPARSSRPQREEIDLSDNEITGGLELAMTAPPRASDAAYQPYLLTGSIPAAIGNLSSLETLALDHNK